MSLRLWLSIWKKKATTDRDYKRRAATRARVVAGPRPRDLSGSSMFFVVGLGGLPDVGMVLARDSVRHVPRASDATVFVVRDMGCVPTGVPWRAVLVGGVVCTWAVVRDKCGPALAFLPALGARRLIWITDAFVAGHPKLVSMLAERLATYNGCGW